MVITELIPLESFRYLFSRWWILIALTILGGVIGCSYHFFQSPIYEAQAELTVTIDLNNISLSQYDEDLALQSAGNLMLTDKVVEEIINHAQSQGIQITKIIILSSFSVERKHAAWVLRVRNSNPETAAILANLWAEQAYAFFVYTQQNTLQVETLEYELNTLQTCLTDSSQATLVVKDSPVVCGSVTINNYQENLQTILNQISIAQQQTGGLYLHLLFGMGTLATIPEQPILYSVATMTFTGALIGFLLGIGILVFRK